MKRHRESLPLQTGPLPHGPWSTGLLQSALLAALITIAGCSKKPSSPDQPSAPHAPLVSPESADVAPSTREEVLTSEVAAGGIATKYRASFVDGQLKLIIESRRGDAANESRGEYEFHGARLLKYAGTPLTGTELIELEFNLQGLLVKARAGMSGEVPATQIDAIKTRAQLLRSHALTQRSVRAHQ